MPAGRTKHLFVCLFGVYHPTREFFTHMETSPLPVKGCKILPMLSTYAIEQWVFFNVPHLQWNGPILYNGHLRRPVILTPVAYCRAFGSGAVTTIFYDIGLSQPGIEPRSPTCEATALPLRHRGGPNHLSTRDYTPFILHINRLIKEWMKK